MEVARRACGKAMIKVGETRAGLISSIWAPDQRSGYHRGTANRSSEFTPRFDRGTSVAGRSIRREERQKNAREGNNKSK